jgi:hypothetical protein
MGDKFEQKVKSVVGESFDDRDVPEYPGRIYYRNGRFSVGFPHAPVRTIEVRFREANASEDGDFTVIEARRVDTSKPDDCFGEWHCLGED